jgi:methyl-accepting chemotaxis protein
VDYRLDFLQNSADTVNLYNGAGQLLLISYNGTLVGATGQPELVGRPAFELFPDFANELPHIQKGETIREYHEEDLKVITPIWIGRTDTPWAVKVLAPVETITAEARRLTQQMIGIGMGLLLGSLVLLWFAARQLATPIKKITNVAAIMARGDLRQNIDVHQADEIGRLADALRDMSASLQNKAALAEQSDSTAASDHRQRLCFRAGADLPG